MVKFADSIRIERTAEEVFNFVTNPETASDWNENIVSHSYLERRTSGVGTRSLWVLREDDKNLEVVETIVDFDAPHFVASDFQVTRYLMKAQDFRGEMVATNYELQDFFRFNYGTKEAHWLNATTCTPMGDDACELTMHFDFRFGGFVGAVLWLRWLFRSSPSRKLLKNIKRQLES